MPEINYKELDAHLEKLKASKETDQPQAYLFHGEELLYKKAYDAFVEELIPPEDRALNCEPVDGAPENIREAISLANTYAMLSGIKIIAIQDSRIFYGNQERGKLLDKAKEAFQREDIRKAAKYILSLLGQYQMTLDDLMEKETLQQFLTEMNSASEAKWLSEIIAYCREKGMSVPSGERPDQFLAAAIEKGFPKGNFLVLTTDLVDKRRTLYKCFKEMGVVVDCSVPKGDRRADRLIQEEVLRHRTAAILEPNSKDIAPAAFNLLLEMTGFDLRTFSNNLEKLVLYIGDRAAITTDDVSAVLERSKKDPIYALTGAVSDRDPGESLKLLDSLLQSGMHPLQVFTAIVNQFRKLVQVKYFSSSPHGGAWRSGMPYQVFNANVLPAMTAYDQELTDMMSTWDRMLSEDDEEKVSEIQGRKSKKKKKGKKQKRPEELLVAANPKNPYPIYLTLKKSDNFSLDELTDIYIQLGETDMKLKRSGRNPKLILEEIILKICRK